MPNLRYDCSRLLQFVSSLEADHVVSFGTERDDTDLQDFGQHPSPPDLYVFALGRGTSPSSNSKASPMFVIAHTKHYLAAQIIATEEPPPQQQEPILLCQLLQDEDFYEEVGDEWITCVTAVCLEDTSVLSKKEDESSTTYHEDDDEDDADRHHANSKPRSPSRRGRVFNLEKSSSQKVLIKGIMPGERQKPHVAVIFGTNQSHVYSIEFIFDKEYCTMQRVNVSNEEEGTGLFEVLPLDDQITVDYLERRSRSRHKVVQPSSSFRSVGFRPMGGVVSFSTFRVHEATYVWVVYGDGTFLRVHHAGFFSSICRRGGERNMSIDQLLGCQALVRCQVRLPPQSRGLKIGPLPKFHPSPLSPLDLLNMTDESLPEATSLGTTAADEKESVEEVPEIFEAIVFGSAAGDTSFPTFAFYTSEVQFEERSKAAINERRRRHSADNDVIGAVVGGTKAIMGGVVGAIKWGFSGSTRNVKTEEESFESSPMSLDESLEHDELVRSPFPSLWRRPLELFACNELHDAPRKIESCAVDPSGNLAALADGLGRVLLIDLESKQVIRMWKGCREASCYWAQVPKADGKTWSSSRSELLLVIHSRQRRAVDVWSVRDSSRVSSAQVGRDAHIVYCNQGMIANHFASVFLVNSRVSGSSGNVMEEISAASAESASIDEQESHEAMLRRSSISRTEVLRLQHFQQILSSLSSDFSQDEILNSLYDIKALKDLATALELLAGTLRLEEILGVKGSEFHKKALKYCSSELKAAEAVSKKNITSNPFFTGLLSRVEYYSQIIKAYDVLFEFESSPRHDKHSDRIASRSIWAAEAMGWTSTSQRVTGISLDMNAVAPPKDPISFTKFATSCAPLNESTSSKIYFTDSSKTRRELLIHLFRPLLADVFSFNVVLSVFDALGTRSEVEYIQKCFAEWFMTLGVRDIFTKGLLSMNSPMIRIVEDLALRQFNSKSFKDETKTLFVLREFCEEAEDLNRAFMLATLCHQAIAKVSKQKEKATYGKIMSSKALRGWEVLLRKLRVCLLVSLRLHKARLPAPITVQNVEEGSNFSVYEWLARDELSMSHNHDELVTLEQACAVSSFAFDPSTPDGDGPDRFKVLQQSCQNGSISEEERAEYLVDIEDDDRSGALLLFFRKFNEPQYLVAHRALLLAAEWSAEPAKLDTLKAVLVALKSIAENGERPSLIQAVCLDVWQVRLCPVYRAHLFGFEDVQEISEEVVAPLLRRRSWVSDFGRISLQLLSLLKNVEGVTNDMEWYSSSPRTKSRELSWPPIQEDVVLKRVLNKLRPLDKSALDAHSVIVCGLVVSEDVETLTRCVPAIFECFLPLSLFNPVTTSPDLESTRQAFLIDALVKQAIGFKGTSLESFDMAEIESLGVMWGVDLGLLRTLFLLAMYELGKDKAVDELLIKSSLRINVHKFVEHGVDILSRRLDAFLSGNLMKSSEMRETMSLLDADLCEWIKYRSMQSRPLIDVLSTDIPIGNTHLFAMRLLSLSASANIDTAIRVNIHSLVVLSGILVKSLAKLPT